jgi:two-component system, sensor histidine kinase PdtaS
MPIDHQRGESQFRLLADNAPMMIWRSDTTKACDFFNKPWLKFTGRSMEEELGFGWAEGVHPEDYDRCVEVYTSAFDARREFSLDYRLRRSDGSYRWLLDNGRPYHDETGSFAGYFGSCVDITEMKEALEEKSVLLRELHHRVRNNMQLITSLLELQTGASGSPEAKAELEAASGRVRSIALAQEQFHDTKQVAGIDFASYLRSLVSSVEAMEEGRLSFSFEADAIKLPLDQAVPVGLMVNEMLTNAVRHAFPGDRQGKVEITARRGEDGRVAIEVVDDGVGLPEGLVPVRPRTLGFRLLRNLGRQTRAALDTVPQPAGTRLRLTFPVS